MKRLKAEQKRRIAGLIAILLIIAMILSAALPLFWVGVNGAESSDYTIEATLGFDGKAKIGYNIPIIITVTNNSGEDFQGQVSALVGVDIASFGDSLKYNRYAGEVDIVSGGTVQTVLSVPIKYIQRNVDLQLTEDEKVVASQEFNLNVDSDMDCWAGILSDSADMLTYLNPSYYGASGDIVDLSKVVGLEDYADFGAVDTYIVNDFDFAALSDIQLREIIDAINMGCTLVIGSQSRIGSVERLGLDEIKPLSNEYVSSSYDASIGFYSQQVANTCDVYRMGRGYIVTANVNFSDSKSVSNNQDISSVLTALFNISFENKSYGENIETNLIAYTDRLPNLSDMTIQVIMVILYFYIAFILVLYFILKKKDRREDAVKIIPVTAVILSVLIYFMSFNTVYKKPIASVINYIDLRSAYSDNVTLKSFINVIAPYKGSIDIEPGGSPRLVSVSDYSFNSYNAYGVYSDKASDDVAATIISGSDGLVIEEKNKTKWDNTYLILENDYSVSGGFEGDVAIDDNMGLTGEIKNNTGESFSEAVITVEVPGRGIVYAKNIGELEDGGSVSLDPLEIAPLELYELGYDGYSNILKPESNDRNNDLDNSYKLELEQDIFEGVISYSYNTGDVDYQEYITVGILGFSESPVYGSDLKVNDRLSETSPINLYRDEIRVNLDTVDVSQLSAYLPTVETENTAQIYGGKLYINDFTDYTELSFSVSDSSDFTVSWNTDAEEILIYNMLNNRWDNLYFDKVYSPSDGYVGTDNRIHIKAYGFMNDCSDLPEISFID